MGWETRGGRRYYYQKERSGSRVRSSYIGNGSTALLVSQLESIRRDGEETKQEVKRRELAELERVDKEIEAVCRLIDTITEAALIAAGFHTHKRQWRKHRHDKSRECSGKANG